MKGIGLYRNYPWRARSRLRLISSEVGNHTSDSGIVHASHSIKPSFPRLIAQEGSSRLLYYPSKIADSEERHPKQGAVKDDKPDLFMIPSLVNRADIVDLDEGNSFIADCQAAGFNVWLVDWGVCGESESKFNLDDYFNRLARLWQKARSPSKLWPRLWLIGYCMGGLLALGFASWQLRLSQQSPWRINPPLVGLTTLATPYDFSPSFKNDHPFAPHPQAWRDRLQNLLPVWQQGEMVSADWLQTWFVSQDPLAMIRKFAWFAEHAYQDEEASRRFVAIEDWAADGVNLAGPVGVETLNGWYGGNIVLNQEWHVKGQPLALLEFSLPCLCVIAEKDRLITPAMSLALPEILAKRPSMPRICVLKSGQQASKTIHYENGNTALLKLAGGHISLMADPKIRGQLITEMASFIRQHQGKR